MSVTGLFPAWSIRLIPAVALVLGVFAASGQARANDLIGPFVGDYVGSAEVVTADGERIPRDMSVSIRANKKGFTVEWTSTTRKPDGRLKSKSYSIDFLPTERKGIYSAGMRRNVFGQASGSCHTSSSSRPVSVSSSNAAAASAWRMVRRWP